MADIQINAVSAGYKGTPEQDDFQAVTGNLRDITVEGFKGDDVLHLGSAVQAGTGDGGKGLGFSIGSSTFKMAQGDDTLTFSGQANSGFSQFRAMSVKLGSGEDFSLINGLASASGSVLKGNSGSDQIIFNSTTAGASTAHDIKFNGGRGTDAITFEWTGVEASDVSVLGGADADTITATFSAVSASLAVSAGSASRGVNVRGNKGNDSLFVSVQGTADLVAIGGNSGSDTIAIGAQGNISRLKAAGGQDNDSISATFSNSISSDATTLQGDLGNDSIVLSLASGGFAQTTNVLGGSGTDVLTVNNNATGGGAGAAFLFGDNNTFHAGTGADTINVNLGNDINTQGTAGFVLNLGRAGTVSGGTAGLGGAINLNLSATQSGGGVRFIGTEAGDVFNISQKTGEAGILNGATFSGESGADSITLDLNTGGAYSAINVDGGIGADVITAEIDGQTLFNAATGGQISVQGGAGSDTLVVNLTDESAGSTLSAGFFAGNEGADVLTVNVGSGGQIGNQNTGSQFFGGSGADTIGFVLASGASAAADIQAGSGADLITATVFGHAATGGTLQGTTAVAGDGNDTIAVTFSVSQTGGAIFQTGGAGAVFAGSGGADSITLLGTVASAGTFDLGQGRGGEGTDTITLGSTLASTGTTTIFGTYNGGLGADSLVFSGNNVLSGAASTFEGNGVNGSGGFIYGTGDSLVDGFDTVFVGNVAVTGGQVQKAGTFGSAGFLFENMTGGSVGDFNMSIATAGSSIVAISAGQAIFNNFADSAGGQVTQVVGISTGGVVAATEQISAGDQGYGAFLASGGSTTAQIFSAVEGLLAGRGQSIAFNIQNGSAGTVDGYVYVDNGALTDSIIKFAGNGLNQAVSLANSAGLYFVGGGGVSAGFTRAGQGGLTRAENHQSGGQLFFGANVGVG
jgi:hypothetical protein